MTPPNFIREKSNLPVFMYIEENFSENLVAPIYELAWDIDELWNLIRENPPKSKIIEYLNRNNYVIG